MKKIVLLLISILVCVSLSACGEPKVLQTEFDALQAEKDGLQNQIDELKNQIVGFESRITELETLNDELNQKASNYEEEVSQLKKQLEESTKTNQTLTEKIDDLENGPAALIVSIRNASESEEWEKVVKLAEELHNRANGSEEDVEGQKLAEAARKAIEKAEAEAAAAKAKEYDTGITFDQLERNPDDYKNQKLKMSGRVLQSFVDGNNSIIMMHPNGNTSKAVYITIATSSLESRVLEGDWITVRGVFNGLYTYQSASGSVMSVPWIKADSIER